MNHQNIYALDRGLVSELQKMREWDESATGRIAKAMLEAAEIRAAAKDISRPESGGTIAVIPIFGMIEQRMSIFGMIFGGTSTERLTAAFAHAMNDPAVKAIVFDVSSGGGSVHGVTEAHAAIRAARGSKPIVSVINSTAGSAAYWLASSADEIVSTPGGVAGSVGVYAIHRDYSKADEAAGIKTEIISAGENKADQVDGAPLSDAGRVAMQAMVDHFCDLFEGDVAAGRGITVAEVKAKFGQGSMMTAPAALKAGMIDRVATLDETLKRLSTPQGRAAVMRAEYVEPVAYDGEAERRILRARVTV